MLPVAYEAALRLKKALPNLEVDGQGSDSGQEDQDDDNAPADNDREDSDMRLPFEGDSEGRIESRTFATP